MFFPKRYKADFERNHVMFNTKSLILNEIRNTFFHNMLYGICHLKRFTYVCTCNFESPSPPLLPPPSPFTIPLTVLRIHPLSPYPALRASSPRNKPQQLTPPPFPTRRHVCRPGFTSDWFQPSRVRGVSPAKPLWRI